MFRPGRVPAAKRIEGSFREQHHVALELPVFVDEREVVVARE